jgi:UDPglucose 6-dehydrogenase
MNTSRAGLRSARPVPNTHLRLGVFGAGYVGLVAAACFSQLGHDVVVCDSDVRKIALLESGEMPFVEPGLAEMVAENVAAKRLRFTAEPAQAVIGRSIVFIAVGTPAATDGRADVAGVRAVAAAIGRSIGDAILIVNKSTVPVETGDLVASIVRAESGNRYDVRVASNPEFLRQGCAVTDFMEPDRIVLGCADSQSESVLRNLYASFDAPIIVVDMRTAEMIKYVANAFLATKISFVNEVAGICERVGVDIGAVVAGAGADPRIGGAFLEAGIGFGGSCLPKDVNALRRTAHDNAVESALLDAVMDVNGRQVTHVVARTDALAGNVRGRRITVWGLAFKAGTDDVRESQAIALIEALLDAGAIVAAHDPLAVPNARAELGDRVAFFDGSDYVAAASGADVLILATAWPIYCAADFEELAAAMRGRIVVDARNGFDPLVVSTAGFVYAGVGR